jgi:hypothetical protein
MPRPLTLRLQGQIEKWLVQGSGIPHLAKNERDMGHPAFAEYVGLGRSRRLLY